MKNFILYVFIVSINNHLWADSKASDLLIDRPIPMGPYYLIGSCEKAKSEIQTISPNAQTHCECKNNECRTELTSHLSHEMQNMLTIVPDLTTDVGPNCFGSVVYAKGLNKKIENIPDKNIRLLIHSPLCEEVKGSPGPGDIVHVYFSKNNWAKLNNEEVIGPDLLGDNHTYMALTSTIAFNKSSPDPADPYEIIQIDDYLNREKVPPECRFTGIEHSLSKNCTDFAVAYRCKDLDQFKRPPGAAGNLEMLTLLASEKLEIPKFEDLPIDLKEEFLKNRRIEHGQRFGDNLRSQKLTIEHHMAMIYLLASPDMNVPKQRLDYNLIMEARKRGIYSKLSLDERLNWGNLYFQSIIE